MVDKHTPTPWEDIDGDVIVGPETDIGEKVVPGEVRALGLTATAAPVVCKMVKEFGRAKVDAALIVRAVNCQQELVEALDKCVGALLGQGLLKEGYHETVCAEARAIIAKVKDEGHG